MVEHFLLLRFSVIVISFLIFINYWHFGFDSYFLCVLGGAVRVLLRNWCSSLVGGFGFLSHSSNIIGKLACLRSGKCFISRSFSDLCLSLSKLRAPLDFCENVKELFTTICVLTNACSFEVTSVRLSACIPGLGGHNRSDRRMLVWLWHDAKNSFVVEVLSNCILHGLH